MKIAIIFVWSTYTRMSNEINFEHCVHEELALTTPDVFQSSMYVYEYNAMQNYVLQIEHNCKMDGNGM